MDVDLQYDEEDADLLNEETFGFLDEDGLTELNDNWELEHQQITKFIEIEHAIAKGNSPARLSHTPSTKHNYNNGRIGSGLSTPESEEEESVIIGNSISQLGLDDDKSFMVKKQANNINSIEFEEIKESWTSPPRIKNESSLDALISPGEGVWASPSRDILRGDSVPEQKRKEGEDIIKKLFGGHNIVTAQKDEKSPIVKAILAEDLERGLSKSPDNMNMSSPHSKLLDYTLSQSTSVPCAPTMNISTSPTILPWTNTGPKVSSMVKPPPYPVNVNMHSFMMMNQQFMPMAAFPSHAMVGIPPPILSPHIMARNPFLYDPVGKLPFKTSPISYRGNKYGGYNSHQSPRFHNRNNNLSWHRPAEISNEDEQFIKMKPSRMMTAKEKEWIFKISLMSLLSGDSNISDYYFISYMNKKLLEKSQLDESDHQNKHSSDEDDVHEDLEKTQQLMNYATKHQQAKESYKPVRFEGSLGKLSITSVHHPRQIMDLSTPEQECQNLSRHPENGKIKFAMYGLVEKMYSTFLSLHESARMILNSSPQEQEMVILQRTEKINSIFERFHINYHDTGVQSNLEHFLHLMSIPKARKLLPRVLLLFDQHQAESLLAALMCSLPALLKKDSKEQALLPIVEKVRIVFSKSSDSFKYKCVSILRELDLKMLLTYLLSARLLLIVLQALPEKDPAVNPDWAYYQGEVGKMAEELSGVVLTQHEIQSLKRLLDITERVADIDE